MNAAVTEKRKMLVYSKEDIQRACDLLLGMPDVAGIKTREKGKYLYVYFKLDKQKYTIRILDHTYSDEADVTFSPLYWYGETWYIDTSVGKYKPEDLPIIIDNLDKAINYYKNKKVLSDIKSFVKDNSSKYKYCNISPLNRTRRLVADYMAKNQIYKDSFGVTRIVLEGMIYSVIMRIPLKY